MDAMNSIPSMNYNDLFMAQNLGLNPGPPQVSSMPMSGPQNVQPPPELQHINDVIGQYIQNKSAPQDTNNFLSEILSKRLQPDLADASRSVFQTGQTGNYVSPDQIMANRVTTQLSPYTEALGLQNSQANLQKTQLGNDITAQTGLPMAMAELRNKQILNDIVEKTGMPLAEADLALKRAQTLEPQMMADYLRSFQGGAPQAAPPSIQGAASPSLPQAMQSNAQPAFNPMGVVLANKLGLKDMQIGPNGQPQMIPGVITPGQKEIDTNFGQALQQYQNAGGDKRLDDSISVIQNTIDRLKAGAGDRDIPQGTKPLITGGNIDAMSLNDQNEPSTIGRLFDRDLLSSRNLISSSILPLAKPLFGARVTNFDAQTLVNSKGIDPLADNKTNVGKLQNFLDELKESRNQLIDSGKYFSQRGTLTGYQPTPVNNPPIAEGSTATNKQTGQKIIFRNGQWSLTQ